MHSIRSRQIGTDSWYLVITTEGRSSLFIQALVERPILKIDQPAATLCFHPHPHHDTARQIYMGLTGVIIVDDGSYFPA
jgi:hypothetical protein